MTPLLKKLIQATTDDGNAYTQSIGNKPCTNFRVWRNNLKSTHPIVYEYTNGVTADVGIEWLKQNLNEEEFVEYVTIKLRGLIAQ